MPASANDYQFEEENNLLQTLMD